MDQPAALLLFPDNDAPQHSLLVDAQRQAARAYDTLKANGTIQRTVVIVDKAGMVRYYQRGLPSTDELLHAIKTF